MFLLMSPTCFQVPRRNADGVDYNKLVRLCAVVEKHGGANLSHHDVYVSVAGGLAVREPAIDLAVVVAVASSYHNIPFGSGAAVVGEVGLSGEIRKVRDLGGRLKACRRLGVKALFAPFGPETVSVPGTELSKFRNIQDLFDTLYGQSAEAATGS